jgi:hypothetical protein
VEDVPRADGRVGHTGINAGSDEQRHVHRGLVEEIAMPRLSVLAEPFSVIPRDHDRSRSGRLALEGGDQDPELLVHRRHLAEVRRLRVAGREGLGRRIRSMGIVVVDLEKQRPLRARDKVSGARSVVCRAR